MTEGRRADSAYSRLGFFEHYTQIRKRIANAGSVVRNVDNIQAVHDRHHLETSSDLQVFVVFSLAGGPAAACFWIWPS